MDGWGSLTMLIKRQEAAKNRKAKLKFDLQKRKESYLKDNSGLELEFPNVTKDEMRTIKQDIRAKYKRKRIKNILLNIFLLIAVFFLFYYILSKKFNS